MFKLKSLSVSENGAIIDIDEKKSKIVGYFSHFGNIDSDGDIIVKGAFKKTILESKRIKHLYQHNPFYPLSGVRNGNLILSEDDKGLKFESTISATSWGRDTIKLYADGVVDEHSVGFEAINSEESKTETVDYYGLKKPVRLIKEIRLWEGSTVTWGANEMAMGAMSKGALIERHEKALKSFRNGTYENDEIFEALELCLKQINMQLSTPPQSTEPNFAAEIDAFNKSMVLNNYLKIK